MPTTYEQWALARYLDALVAGEAPGSPGAELLDGWIEKNRVLIGLTEGSGAAAMSRRKRKRKQGRSAADRKTLCWDLRAARLAALAAPEEAPRPGPWEENLWAFCAAFDISDTECAILELLLRYERVGPFANLCDRLVKLRAFDSDQLIAVLLRCEVAVVRQHLGQGRLRAAGLVTGANGAYDNHLGYDPCSRLATALMPPNRGLADIETALLGPAQYGQLEARDFDHLARGRDFLAAVLRAAVAGGERGVNLLLYGPAGTGKTELCRLAAGLAGCDLFAPRDEDEGDSEPRRADRLAALRLAQRVAQRRRFSVLLFDEMEDLLGDGIGGVVWGARYRQRGSKTFVNRLLEENPVPVLWTTNDIAAFDPALLRRMTFALEVKAPPAGPRASVLRSLTRQAGLAFAAPDLEGLAREIAASPGLYANAVRATRLAGKTVADLRYATTALAQAVQGGQPLAPVSGRPSSYDPGLVNCDLDLAVLERQLLSPSAVRDISFCLYGPPGTGKTAYVRHLAQRLGLPLSHKRCSDLVSKWVGESEQAIAEAFRSAREEGTFLVFDEADSILGDRAGARQTWEVSQVNEMLTWMEDHPLPFACTTNLLERLDRAALRRFTFKLRFDYLRRDQARAAYRLFFGRGAPAALDELPCLTPADFALVAKKLAILGPAPDHRDILAGLEREVALKPEVKRPIGFHTG